ncbi:hypothetical protein HB364_24340 [Pseudoflavitalea sp. X16]|uniref:hypothetical protein n=1 Tax=Paraflavitalea devenefica TaxID=2716334 RepID=UPI0014233B04|nr:hypothetical protein [Paraflavitalea devenefica]NII28235.1 hypothetical protein [Paraflavitalea devenefica]
MNLLHYEFIDGPDDSINGMLRKLVTDVRYNRSMVSIEEFRATLPSLKKIEQQVQHSDTQIGRPYRNYIEEIMQELEQESENEINIEDDLRRATVATITSILGQQLNFESLSFSIGKAEHYPWLRFSGYLDESPADANIVIAREVFRSICNKYNYIFIDLS